MDDSDHSSKLDSKTSKEQKLETQASKRRKVVEKTVLAVKIEASDGKQKSEGPPSDCWSWRKYGQKPIKGSPYPRGYYKCSTSKGCSAKKQVERCKTDSSMLIITYTSTHNHPGPDLTQPKKEPQIQPSEPTTSENLPTTPKQEKEQEQEEQPTMTSTDKDPSTDQDDHFHYSQSPFYSSQDIIINQEENPFTETLESTPTILFDEQPISYPHLITFSTTKSEENDFYDELEELPCISSSSFTSFMRSNFFDEGILVHPS